MVLIKALCRRLISEEWHSCFARLYGREKRHARAPQRRRPAPHAVGRRLSQGHLSSLEPGRLRRDQRHRRDARSGAAFGERHGETAFGDRIDRARAVSWRATHRPGPARGPQDDPPPPHSRALSDAAPWLRLGRRSRRSGAAGARRVGRPDRAHGERPGASAVRSPRRPHPHGGRRDRRSGARVARRGAGRLEARAAPGRDAGFRAAALSGGAGSRTWWRRALAFAGPGYLVAVGYMDPGNWATDLAGGSAFGYTLLSVILVSNLMAILLQGLAAKLGIVTGRDLAQACRDHYSRPATL